MCMETKEIRPFLKGLTDGAVTTKGLLLLSSDKIVPRQIKCSALAAADRDSMPVS